MITTLETSLKKSKSTRFSIIYFYMVYFKRLIKNIPLKYRFFVLGSV